MKFWNWLRSRSQIEILMIIVITSLIIMIATRWSYISRMTGTAFKQRFTPLQEQTDTLHTK